jgi:hypothetical protein
MSKVIMGELGINRSSNGFIYIRIEDSNSRAKFVELKLTCEQFAEAVTGLHTCDVEMTVSHLDRVGKRRVRESRSVVCPLDSWKREVQQAWLVENCQEEGWILDAFLGSQTSTKSVDGGTRLNYAVFKYIDEVK